MSSIGGSAMRVFPFPDKIRSREELGRDLLFHKIPKEDIERISDKAWETGSSAAKALAEKYGAYKSIGEIAKEDHLIIEHVNKDHVVGKVRYFSEYYSGRNKIVLYMDSIGKWAAMNGLPLKEAEELILSHEYFHFLECTKLGLISRQYTVPTIKIGRFSFGKSGIRALSEIGAHGFSRTFYEGSGRMKDREKADKEMLLCNEAVSPLAFDGKNRAQKIFNSGFKSVLRREDRRRKQL